MDNIKTWTGLSVEESVRMTHTHPASRYQKGKTNLDFTEARDSDWQWHQLGHANLHLAPDR